MPETPPPQTDWLWYLLAGQAAPRGDPAALRQVAACYDDAREWLLDLARQVREVSPQVLGGFSGPAADQAAQYLNQLPAFLAGLAVAAGTVADTVRQVALQIEYGLYLMYMQAVLTAGLLIQAAVTVFGAAEEPGIIGAGQAVIRKIGEQL